MKFPIIFVRRSRLEELERRVDKLEREMADTQKALWEIEQQVRRSDKITHKLLSQVSDLRRALRIAINSRPYK
ncbi:hypothetical protein AAAX65_07415 [Alistipes finegoldii]|jgi:hypothetical protein|uniref:hypothetical protein n=1 Tax=Alistipes finegoldii TaxID=214856 RepID=UPI0032C02854